MLGSRDAEPSQKSLRHPPPERPKKESPTINDKRLPFTLSIIHLMVSQLRTGFFSSYTNALLEAVFLSAFYGFLRF